MGLLIAKLLSIANCSIRMKGMSSWQTSVTSAIVSGKKNKVEMLDFRHNGTQYSRVQNLSSLSS